MATLDNSSEPPDLYKDSFKYFRNYSESSRRRKRGPSIRRSKRKSGPATTIVLPLPGQPDHDIRSLESSSCDDDDNKNNFQKTLSFDANTILLEYPPSQNECNNDVNNFIKEGDVKYDPVAECECHKMWGLRSPETWKVVELVFPSGLIVIKNPFTTAGQRYWISRTLLDFPHDSEYITNMDNLNRLEKLKKGERISNLKDFKLDTCGRDFYQTLRWVTFGYHHDWDTKVYTEQMRSDFPKDLGDMTRYIAQTLGFQDFQAEAAIANYYHMDSTLSGHVDKSEVNQHAPLFSLSFGQSCIFLIGGKTKAERPQAVLLQSGDIAVMSGESRLSYHGVPAIIQATSRPWDFEDASRDCDNNDVNDVPRKDNSCVPINKKQRLDTDTERCSAQYVHDCQSFKLGLGEPDVFAKLAQTKWTNFLANYIGKSRINLNIRQVLFPGQNFLSDDIIVKS